VYDQKAQQTVLIQFLTRTPAIADGSYGRWCSRHRGSI